MIRSFLLGALAGGLAVWVWKDDIQDYLDSRALSVRERAADGLHAVEETVSANLQAAEKSIRP